MSERGVIDLRMLGMTVTALRRGFLLPAAEAEQLADTIERFQTALERVHDAYLHDASTGAVDGATARVMYEAVATVVPR